MSISEILALIGLVLTFFVNIGVVVWAAGRVTATVDGRVSNLTESVSRLDRNIEATTKELSRAIDMMREAVNHLDRRLSMVEVQTDNHKWLLRRDDEKGDR